MQGYLGEGTPGRHKPLLYADKSLPDLLSRPSLRYADCASAMQ